MNQEKALHKQFFRIEIAILIGTFLIQALFIFYLHSLNLIIPYSDVISHLNIARRVIDDSYPGIAQLGNSWLPITHIFYLPFKLS